MAAMACVAVGSLVYADFMYYSAREREDNPSQPPPPQPPQQPQPQRRANRDEEPTGPNPSPPASPTHHHNAPDTLDDFVLMPGGIALNPYPQFRFFTL